MWILRFLLIHITLSLTSRALIHVLGIAPSYVRNRAVSVITFLCYLIELGCYLIILPNNRVQRWHVCPVLWRNCRERSPVGIACLPSGVHTSLGFFYECLVLLLIGTPCLLPHSRILQRTYTSTPQGKLELTERT